MRWRILSRKYLQRQFQLTYLPIQCDQQTMAITLILGLDSYASKPLTGLKTASPNTLLIPSSPSFSRCIYYYYQLVRTHPIPFTHTFVLILCYPDSRTLLINPPAFPGNRSPYVHEFPVGPRLSSLLTPQPTVFLPIRYYRHVLEPLRQTSQQPFFTRAPSRLLISMSMEPPRNLSLRLAPVSPRQPQLRNLRFRIFYAVRLP